MFDRSGSLENELAAIDRDLRQMRASQFVDYTSVITQANAYNSFVPSSDLTGGGGGYIGQFWYRRVTFIADNQLNPWGSISFDIEAPLGTPVGDDDIFIFNILFQPLLVDDKKLEWIVDLRSNNTTSPAYTRFYVRPKVGAGDTGTITVSAV